MRLPPRIPRTVPWGRLKAPRAGNSRAHLGFVRSLPCCACAREPAGQAHHLLRVEGRGMGMKAEDRFTVPLCPACHASLHASGAEDGWMADRGVDGRTLADRLWKITGDHEAGRRMCLRRILPRRP